MKAVDAEPVKLMVFTNNTWLRVGLGVFIIHWPTTMFIIVVRHTE